MTIEFRDYFDRTLDVLIGLTAPLGFSQGPRLEQFGSDLGLLEAQLHYPGGQRLTVSLLVDNSGEIPLWRRYSFHLQEQSDECVFRYDNAGHHPEMLHFPHHKHVGPQEKLESARPPTIHQLAREIAAQMERR